MLIYGKQIRDQMKSEFADWSQGKSLELVVMRFGDDPSALFYIKGIQNYVKDLDVNVNIFQFPENYSEERLITHIEQLNHDPAVNAILMQKPFPSSIDEYHVIDSMNPLKDIEGVHTVNLGRLVRGEPGIQPVTPKSVIKILKSNNIDVACKNITILGRSANVSSPLALMLTRENGTVTVCHSKTRDIEQYTRSADIVVAAVGGRDFVTPDMISSSAVIVDVGANAGEDGKMVGDASAAAIEKAAAASAVPGGVGALTVAELFDNLQVVYALQQGHNFH
ncbi:MAG: bifunctional 5,10-methylenetetrahydrofolate dehydrogenase/5,10-methenyltetrahydrofolate cyclohydrolase [Candidatus Saccharibacteria bacterium]